MKVKINQLEVSREPFEETDWEMPIWCRLYTQCECTEIVCTVHGIFDTSMVNSEKDLKECYYKEEIRYWAVNEKTNNCPKCGKDINNEETLETFCAKIKVIGMENLPDKFMIVYDDEKSGSGVVEHTQKMVIIDITPEEWMRGANAFDDRAYFEWHKYTVLAFWKIDSKKFPEVALMDKRIKIECSSGSSRPQAIVRRPKITKI